MSCDASITLFSEEVEQTHYIGECVGSVMRSGEIIALVGDLGAGKTQFVRGLAKGMGIRPEIVSSPTFVVMHEYERDDLAGLVLVHIDAYRLESAADLASIGWEDDGDEIREDAVVAIEWATLISQFLPQDMLSVRIQHNNPGRSITLTGQHQLWNQRLNQIASETATAGIAHENGI